MKTKKEDKLRKLLKSAGPDKAIEGFTQEVMDSVEAMSLPELADDKGFKAILKERVLEQPAVDFTASVMKEVALLEKSHMYQPLLDEDIIPKKAWYLIAASVAAAMLGVILSGQASEVSLGWMPYVVGLGNSLTLICSQIKAIPSLYLLILIAFSALFSLDYIVNTKALITRLNHT